MPFSGILVERERVNLKKMTIKIEKHLTWLN